MKRIRRYREDKSVKGVEVIFGKIKRVKWFKILEVKRRILSLRILYVQICTLDTPKPQTPIYLQLR